MGLIGGALGAVGSILGGMSASKAMKRAKQGVEDQRQENRNWFDRRYNEDATQRADARRILTLTEENIKNRNKQAEGRQAVMGGTEESMAATKSANNLALADATAQIAVNGQQRKDAIERQYRQRDAALGDQLGQFETNKANAISGAVQGLAKAAGEMKFGKIEKDTDKDGVVDKYIPL